MRILGITKLNLILSVTHYLELHNAIYLCTIDINSYQVNILMFYNVQTSILTFVGKIGEVR